MFKFEDPKFYSANPSSSGFNDRQKNLFDTLECAEKEKVKKYGAFPTFDSSVSLCSHSSRVEGRKPKMKQFLGQESIFKKPTFRPPKSHRRPSIPDYQLNPQKWTKYSLADVSPDDMSDKSNTATALAFLQELKDRRLNNEENINIDLDKAKFIFKRITESDQRNLLNYPSCDSRLSTKCFSKSKVIMPEYVVGQKRTSRSKPIAKSDCSKQGCSSKGIKLDHLIDEECD